MSDSMELEDFCFYFSPPDSVSLYSLGYLGTHSVSYTGLEWRDFKVVHYF